MHRVNRIPSSLLNPTRTKRHRLSPFLVIEQIHLSTIFIYFFSHHEFSGGFLGKGFDNEILLLPVDCRKLLLVLGGQLGWAPQSRVAFAVNDQHEQTPWKMGLLVLQFWKQTLLKNLCPYCKCQCLVNEYECLWGGRRKAKGRLLFLFTGLNFSLKEQVRMALLNLIVIAIFWLLIEQYAQKKWKNNWLYLILCHQSSPHPSIHPCI